MPLGLASNAYFEKAKVLTRFGARSKSVILITEAFSPKGFGVLEDTPSSPKLHTPKTLLHEKQAEEFSPRFGASNHIARYTDLILRGVANVRSDACGKSI
jgi:hypothetical protein